MKVFMQIIINFKKFSCFFRYAYFKNLDYFSTECIYSPNAYRWERRLIFKKYYCFYYIIIQVFFNATRVANVGPGHTH